MASALTYAILAGGAATRLDGRDKGLEPAAGRVLVERVLAGLGDDGAKLVVANRNLETYAGFAHVITDALPGHRGPLAGIAAALAHVDTPWLVTVPVDCPDPPPRFAARLLAVVDGEGVVSAVAHDGERRQPLFAIYARSLAASAAEAAARGEGAWQWQRAIGAREVDFSEARAHFANLNTPGEFAAYAERLR